MTFLIEQIGVHFLFFLNVRGNYTLYTVSCVQQSSTVCLQMWAALMDPLCCSAGHFRRTRLELASCVLPVISWAPVSIKYFLLKITKMGSVSCIELWLRPSLRQVWNMAPKFLELIFTERQNPCVLSFNLGFVIAWPITCGKGDTVLRF